MKIIMTSILFLLINISLLNSQTKNVKVELYFGGNYLPLKSTVNQLKNNKREFSNFPEYNFSIKHTTPYFEFIMGYTVFDKFNVLISTEYISPSFEIKYLTPEPDNQKGSYVSKYSAIPFSLALRYDLFEYSSWLKPYIEIGFSYYLSKETTLEKLYIGSNTSKNSYSINGSGYGYYGGIGSNYNLNSHLSVLFRFKYRYSDGFYFTKDYVDISMSKQLQYSLKGEKKSKPDIQFSGFCFALGVSYAFHI